MQLKLPQLSFLHLFLIPLPSTWTQSLTERRKSNLIVYNFPEASTDLNVTECTEKDIESFKQMIRVILDKDPSNLQVKKALWLGKSLPDKPRPLLISLQEESHKKEILRQARKLRKLPNWTNTFFSPDYTCREREANKVL